MLRGALPVAIMRNLPPKLSRTLANTAGCLNTGILSSMNLFLIVSAILLRILGTETRTVTFAASQSSLSLRTFPLEILNCKKCTRL